MGVYHVSGLGLSPGAVTVPLSAVYILKAAAQFGHQRAIDFFSRSGEHHNEREGKEGSSENDANRGLPEVIIILDSREAIEGKLPVSYESHWFRMKAEKKPEPVYKPITKYLCKLIETLNNAGATVKPPKEFYALSVNHQDFEDVLDKAGMLFYGLRDKEIWVNLIGGSNQVNLGLMIAGATTPLLSWRYYYMAQNNIRLLEPEDLPVPKDERTVLKIAGILLDRWYDILPLNIGLGNIIQKLVNHFQASNFISENQLNKIVKGNRNLINKLLSSGYLVERPGGFTVGPTFKKTGAIFHRLLNVYPSTITNTVIWKNKAKELGILKEVDFQC